MRYDVVEKKGLETLVLREFEDPKSAIHFLFHDYKHLPLIGFEIVIPGLNPPILKFDEKNADYLYGQLELGETVVFVFSSVDVAYGERSEETAILDMVFVSIMPIE